jgi:hypothetical protein
MTPGGVAKVGTGLYRGARGIQALEATTAGQKALNATGTAAYYGVPSYGQIRDEQELEGRNSASDIARAGLSSLAVGAIESFAGPEAALARGWKGAGAAGKNFVRTGLKQGAFEAGEEILQTPIEAYGAGRDPFSAKTLDEALAGGVAGFIGGAPMGMAMHPFMRKTETAQRLDAREEVNLTDPAPTTATSTAQARVNAGRNLPQLGLDVPPVITVTPQGEALTDPNAVEAYNEFGKNLKPMPKFALETAKTRNNLRDYLNQELESGSITQEQHVDATNAIDMAKGKKIADLKLDVQSIITPQEQTAEVAPSATATSIAMAEPVNLAAAPAAENVVAPAGIARTAAPEEVQQFQAETAAQLSQALTPKQIQAIQSTRGVRNAEDSGWEVDPNTGEEMVPMSNAVMGKMNDTSRQNVSKNAQTGLKKLYKRAADLGLTPEAADRILGIQGEQAIDVGSMSEAQAAQAGLSYRATQGRPTSAMAESDDLDTTSENFQPEAFISEDVGLAAPQELMAQEATAEGFEAPNTESIAEEPTETEEGGYEQDYNLKPEDLENAKDIWEVLAEELARDGEQVPSWKEIPVIAFEKFAATARFHLNNPQGVTSVAAIGKAQQEAIDGTTTSTGTTKEAVTRTESRSQAADEAVDKRAEPAVSSKKRGRKAKVEEVPELDDLDI